MAASVASLDHIVMQMHCLVNLCVAKFQAAQPTRPVAQSATSSRTGSRDSGSPSMAREIVVVHSSDLHVEAEPTAPEWGGDGTRNLAMVLEAAQRVQADLVLLAGDTFDSHRQPGDFIERVAKMLAAAPVPVVILPGNHDPIVMEAVYHRMR